MSLTKEDLTSAVETAVTKAMKGGEAPKEGPLGLLECPDCHVLFKEVPRFVDHRINERFDKKIAEIQAPDPQKLVMDCKDGICKMVDEHLEATYDIRKRGDVVPVVEEEEAGGLFGNVDEPEEEK